MLPHDFVALPFLWHILFPWWLFLIFSESTFFLPVFSVWLSYITLFCIAIAQTSFYYQSMKETHIPRIQNGYSTPLLLGFQVLIRKEAGIKWFVVYVCKPFIKKKYILNLMLKYWMTLSIIYVARNIYSIYFPIKILRTMLTYFWGN